MDELLPAAWCARKVKVSRQLFYSWVRRGLIEPAGEAADGRPVYSVAAARRVEVRTRLSGCSSRAKLTDSQRAALLASIAS